MERRFGRPFGSLAHDAHFFPADNPHGLLGIDERFGVKVANHDCHRGFVGWLSEAMPPAKLSASVLNRVPPARGDDIWFQSHKIVDDQKGFKCQKGEGELCLVN